MRVNLYLLLTIGLVCSAAVAQEKTFSGPQPGERISSFKVLEVSGPFDAKEIEIANANQPTLLVFVHKISEPAIGLMISLEWYASKQKKLSDHYVFLVRDKAETEQKLKRWAQRSFFTKSHMSVSLDGAEGPGRYGLNRNVDMTVLVAKDRKVLSNFALLGPNNTDAQKILTAVAKSLGKSEPSYEKIRDEIRAERSRKRAARQKANPVFKLAPAEALGKLMMSMLYGEGITAEHVARVSDQMQKWAGDKKEKRAALAQYCKKVLDGDFEVNRYAREALEKMSKFGDKE